MTKRDEIIKKLSNIQGMAEETKKTVSLSTESEFVECMKTLVYSIAIGMIQAELNELRELVGADDNGEQY